MFFQNINYIVALIASVVGVGLGFLWFAPWTFGPAWMKSRNANEEALRAKMARPMAPVYIATLAGKFLGAFVLAALLNSLVVTSLGGMILLAVCVWAGFSVPIKLTDYLFSADSFKNFLISIGYELFVTIVMALIIGIWG